MNRPVIFDGHNDTLLNLYLPQRGQGRSFFEQSEIGHIDLPRARKGNWGGGFFAIFVPAPEARNDLKVSIQLAGKSIEMPAPIDPDDALEMTRAMIKLLFEIEKNSQAQVKVVRTVDELTNCLEAEVLAAVMHFEGAEAIDTDLKRLQEFYELGLRSLGLVWSRANAFGCGVPFMVNYSPDTGPGLTAAGKELVKACNSLGIMIDLSHLNEKGFWDVAKISDKPLVATHSCVHAISPKPRNLLDKQLDAIADSSGVVGLNFCVADWRPDGQSIEETPLSCLVDHIDYMVERIGIDHVALGSDFDGAPMCNKMSDVTKLPGLIDLLSQRGYDQPALQKICWANWISLLKRTWGT
jgi:membrane dipeptidase